MLESSNDVYNLLMCVKFYCASPVLSLNEKRILGSKKNMEVSHSAGACNFINI